MDTPKKAKYRRLAFFAGGAATTTVAFAVSFYWLDFGAWVLGKPGLAYNSQPDWMRQAGTIVGYSPWVVGALVLLARLRCGKGVRVIAFGVGAFVPYFVLVGSLILGPVVRDHLNRTSFDASTWSDPGFVHSDRPIRIRMVDDLLHKHDLHGKTVSSVKELLGSPDQTGYFSDWDLVYWLGPERGMMSIDSEWLVIRLDEDQRVSDYRLVTD